MDLNIICSVALGISLCLLILSVVLGVILHHAEMKNARLDGRRRVLTPFQIFVVCFFFAAVTIFYPMYYLDFLAAESGFLKIIKAFLLAVQNVLGLVMLNGDFTNIRDFLGNPALNAVLREGYSFYAALIFVAAPLLTAGFVLSFFRNASAMLRYSLRPCRELYVMSELNEQSLALAQNIFEEKRRGRVVIFADVMEQDEDDLEQVYTARRMGAICVKKDITDLGLKYARKCRRKIYLIGENEDENIGQALKLINRHRGTKYDSSDLEIYVFSQTAESEALLDSVDNGHMRVRRVNGSLSLALTEMRAHPIFRDAAKNDGEQHICIAIVGFGGYGMQFLKTICCLGQMPGWTVEIHVFDGKCSEARFRAAAPGLMELNGKKIEGDAEYSIVFHDCIDVRSQEFIVDFCSVKDYTGIYVALGEDELNIETAMRLRTAVRRGASSSADAPIYAVVYDPVKAEIMANGGLKNMEGAEYGITLIGSLQETFSVGNIEQRELEEGAFRLHIRWANTEAEKREAKIRFEQYEYYRRSSMMQAVYRELRQNLGYVRQSEETAEGKAYNGILRLYEHRRWNTYMRGEGYVLGERKDHIAKTHPMLIPFENLSEAEKSKDDF